MSQLNLLTAALAGLVSFLSPCVLPLIPGYISFISGVSLEDLRAGDGQRRIAARALVSSLWFVAGFTLVFVALGASATALGSLLLQRLSSLRLLAGAVLILFGLHLTGLFRIPFLQYEKKLEVKRRPLTSAGALVVGAAFAFGWTPCIGPILAGILALASAQETLPQGMMLLAAYSLGLGAPFLLTSLGVGTFLRLFSKFRKHLRAVEIFSGVLLLGIGALILTDRLDLLARHLSFFNRFAM